MTDSELLELAAKAAGYVGSYWIEPQYTIGFTGAIRTEEHGDWNPLTDDGDALRLAVKLRLPIRDGFNGTVVTGNEKSCRPIWEIYGDDPYAATRRAIVRAAAEIGKEI